MLDMKTCEVVREVLGQYLDDAIENTRYVATHGIGRAGGIAEGFTKMRNS